MVCSVGSLRNLGCKQSHILLGQATRMFVLSFAKYNLSPGAQPLGSHGICGRCLSSVPRLVGQSRVPAPSTVLLGVTLLRSLSISPSVLGGVVAGQPASNVSPTKGHLRCMRRL